MSLTDMCRLCSSSDNLVWVFDKRFENNDSMKYVIFVTTGVEIHTTDAISQKICEKCCHIIIKMFEFRKNSLENDRRLKERLKALKGGDDVVPPLPTEVQIKEEIPDASPQPLMHPSVQEVFDRYPMLKLPRQFLYTNFKPLVILKMDAVEDYFKERKLDFNERCKLALQTRRTARKRTLPLSQTKSIYTDSSPCSISGEIVPQDMEDVVDKGVLRPIKIKIIPKLCFNENATESGAEICRRNEKESSLLEIENTAPFHKKRKLQDSPTKENEVPKAAGFPEKTSDDTGKSWPYLANGSVPLHMCNICDSVHYTFKDLKRHRHKHLRCQFCKTSFHSLADKTEHLNQCLIKNTINNFPCIDLKKLEMDGDITKKYSRAFREFPSLFNNQDAECFEISSNESETEGIKSLETNSCVAKQDEVEVIEIISDDDIPTNGITNKSPAPPPNVSRKLIKPDVKIINNPLSNIIGSISNETDLLQKLLTYGKPRVEKAVQTMEKLDVQNIEMDEANTSAVIKNFRQNVYTVPVPVEIKKGSFNVCFKPVVDNSKPKVLRLWNDLTPIDVKKNLTGDAAALLSSTTICNNLFETVPAAATVSSATSTITNSCTILETALYANRVPHPTCNITSSQQNYSVSDTIGSNSVFSSTTTYNNLCESVSAATTINSDVSTITNNPTMLETTVLYPNSVPHSTCNTTSSQQAYTSSDTVGSKSALSSVGYDNLFESVPTATTVNSVVSTVTNNPVMLETTVLYPNRVPHSTGNTISSQQNYSGSGAFGSKSVHCSTGYNNVFESVPAASTINSAVSTITKSCTNLGATPLYSNHVPHSTCNTTSFQQNYTVSDTIGSKSVSSTHNSISVVGPSVSSTFPPGKATVTSNISENTNKNGISVVNVTSVIPSNSRSISIQPQSVRPNGHNLVNSVPSPMAKSPDAPNKTCYKPVSFKIPQLPKRIQPTSKPAKIFVDFQVGGTDPKPSKKKPTKPPQQTSVSNLNRPSTPFIGNQSMKTLSTIPTCSPQIQQFISGASTKTSMKTVAVTKTVWPCTDVVTYSAINPINSVSTYPYRLKPPPPYLQQTNNLNVSTAIDMTKLKSYRKPVLRSITPLPYVAPSTISGTANNDYVETTSRNNSTVTQSYVPQLHNNSSQESREPVLLKILTNNNYPYHLAKTIDQSQACSNTPTSVTSVNVIPTTSCPVSSMTNRQQLGHIRVKNMWELT